jgi:hypothetical protein
VPISGRQSPANDEGTRQRPSCSASCARGTASSSSTAASQKVRHPSVAVCGDQGGSSPEGIISVLNFTPVHVGS